VGQAEGAIRTGERARAHARYQSKWWRRKTLMRAGLSTAVLAAIPLIAQTMPNSLLEAKLRLRLQKIDEHASGILGVAAIDLTTGRTILHNADVLFPTASTIKVPILIEMFHLARAGEFKWSDSITLEPGDSVGGSGHLQEALAKGAVTLTTEELVAKMIIDSDNTATNRVISMAKMERVNRLVQEIGASQTRLRRIMMDTAAAAKGSENVTTPLEMARIVESIYRHKAADAADCESMLAIMKRVPGAIRSAVPQEIEVASKTGTLEGVHCEVAIVYAPVKPFVLSVYSTFLDKDENPLPEVSKLVFEYFHEKLGKSNAYGNRVR
jgi:beta-lactamase class A